MNAGESKELQKKGGCSFLGRAAVPSAAAGKRTPSDALQSFTATASEFREKGNFESLEKEPGTCGSPKSCRDALVWSSLEQTKGAGDCQMTHNNDSGSSKQF